MPKSSTFATEEEEALWADRLALAIRRIQLAAEHDRIVRMVREGVELLTRMRGHRERAALVLDLAQLPGLVPDTEAEAASQLFLSVTLAATMSEVILEDLERDHRAVHMELGMVDLLVAAHDAELDRLYATPAEPPAAPLEYAVSSLRG